MITVAETPIFSKQAERLFTEDQYEKLILFLAENPEGGSIIPGTGGVRKIRFQLPGRGKRGGARVVYFYFDDDFPLIALTVLAKNEREDLSPEGKKAVSQLAEEIKMQARRKR